MKPTLNNLVKGIIAANGDIPSIPIKNIQLHSGNVKPGDLYIAVHGTTSDGHDYIPEALENGASAVITNGRDVGTLPVPQVKVSNPRKAASFVAAEYYMHPSKELHIVGITGTNGKTSTATLISSILNGLAKAYYLSNLNRFKFKIFLKGLNKHIIQTDLLQFCETQN